MACTIDNSSVRFSSLHSPSLGSSSRIWRHHVFKTIFTHAFPTSSARGAVVSAPGQVCRTSQTKPEVKGK